MSMKYFTHSFKKAHIYETVRISIDGPNKTMNSDAPASEIRALSGNCAFSSKRIKTKL